MAGIEQNLKKKTFFSKWGCGSCTEMVLFSEGTSESNTYGGTSLTSCACRKLKFSDQSAITGLVSEGKKRPQEAGKLMRNQQNVKRWYNLETVM